jgi:hypothetical protein
MKTKLLLLLCVISFGLSAQKWGDYTLYSTQSSTSTYLMDTTQTIVKTWSHAGYKTGYSSYLAPGGYLYKTISKTGNSFTGGPICGQLIKMDWAGNILWEYTYSTTEYCSHHDFHVMPNGNVLLIAYERHSAAEVAAAGGSFNGEVWSEHVAEIKQTGPTTGEVVWKWRVWDHLLQTTDPSKPNYFTSALSHPELLNINYNLAKDWIHMNGIDYNPILDQIAVSSHNLNEWYIIDHSTTTEEAAGHTGGNAGKGGDFLFRWGNPAAYGATGTKILNVTHDAHWIPEGVPNAGRLVGFNNRGVSSSKSAVDQIITPRVNYNYTRTEGAAFEPATYTERHASTGYTSNMGNSQQLPNGNMLVCLAISGVIYEINASGTTLWSKTMGGSVAQSFKYNKCYTENAAPAIPSISINGSKLSASAGDSYQWYLNGNLISGATSQDFTIQDSGVYVVRITKAPSCQYSYSPGFKVGSSNPGTGLKDLHAFDNLLVYPNPSQAEVFVSGLNEIPSLLQIFDMQGRLMTSSPKSSQISVSQLPQGVYLLQINLESGNAITKKIIVNN